MIGALPARYRVIRKAGQGGQGSVWCAADRFRGDALVAVKVVALPTGEGVGTAEERLSREFLTLAGLAHPNISRVRDFGFLSRGRGAYFTSDFVDGPNLLEWSLAFRGEERWKALLHITFQALAVLQYLSARNIHHGDLKPANLLVELDPTGGRPPTLKLIDFGAARLRDARGLEAQGTLAYLPPPRAARNDPDLHGLGISLYHAAMGRLPFAVGDVDSLRAWWSAGGVARPRDMDPSVPAAMDSLITGLTTADGDTGFRSAAEALEFLKARVAPPPPVRPLAGAEAPAAGREAFLEALSRRIASGAVSGTVPVICAVPALGKEGLLDALEARLQSRGLRTLLFAGLSDAHGVQTARELVLDLVGLGATPDPAGVRDDDALALRLVDLGVVVLLDDEVADPESGPALELLRAIASGSRAPRAGRSLPLLVAATTDPVGLARRLGLAEKDLETHPVDPLSVAAIREIAREYFAVDSFPAELASRIEAESGGAPSLVHEALEALASAGASVDFLGRFKPPESTGTALVARGRTGPLPGALSPVLRRSLGLFIAAGEPLDPDDASLRFPEWSPALWKRHLDSLRARGFLRRDERREGAYRLTPSASGIRASDLLGDEELAARISLARIVDGLLRPTPATSLAAAANRLALGDVDAAARWGLAAARGLLREERDAEDPLPLVGVLASVEGRAGAAGPRARRRAWALRLRAAQALDRAARTEEALDLLAEGAEGAPAWYEKGTKLLRAEILERAGRVPEAILELEGVAGTSLEDGRSASGHIDSAAMEAAARLAALYFRAGVARSGRACLQLGRDVLAAARSRKNGIGGASAARALGLFARAESSHGDAEIAMALLEEALRIVRGTGREDLARGPLNELGILYAKHRRWANALEVFGEIAAAARGRGDLRGALKAAYNQAIIHYRLHDLDLAENLFREARRISEELGRHDLEAAILVGFAGVLRERGRWLPALKLYRRVIRLGPGARPHDLALAHGNIRELYLLLGRPGKSIRHANLAYRIARGLEDKFLRAATLRFRGIARWALGRSVDARRDLERALRGAEEAGDARAAGAASHYLGLLASAEGDAGEAIRRLRAGLVSSRRAGDARHASLGKAAVLSELSSLGRRRAARHILLGVGTRTSQWARASLQARVLAMRADPRWPIHHEEVIDACAGAAREGLVWEAFLSLTDALRDPDLSDVARDTISLARAAVAARILRAVPRRFEEGFRRHWALEEEAPEVDDRSGEGKEARLVDAPAAAGALGPLSSFLEHASSGKAYLRALLEDIASSAGASGAWVAHDESIDRQPFPGPGRKAGGGAPRGHEAALARARQTGVPVESAPYLFLKLPHPRASRVLCVELGVRHSREVIDGILSRAATAALALRLVDVEEDLRGERARHEEASTEVHRLNVAITKDRQDLETALLTQRLEANELRRELAARSDEPLGSRPPAAASPAMLSILSRLAGIAARDIPVLLTGESGVGKDFLARWIHRLSPRRGGAFVAEICDVPESLIEAELFGFVKGSFTGAVSDRPGLFQRASGGTIYLDEISELASAVQARLLRVLEEKKVRPVGGEESLPVDFRLISSSRHAASELPARGLRRDLLFRINAEVIEVPPLRERPEDIPILLEEAIKEHTRVTGLPAPYVHPDVKDLMVAHDWPGNVRELFNEVERILVERPVEVTPDMLILGKRWRTESAATPLPSLREERSRVEQELLVRALQESGGNASKAAKRLQITRRYLGMLLNKHGLRLEEMRSPEPTGRRQSTAGGRTQRPKDPARHPNRRPDVPPTSPPSGK